MSREFQAFVIGPLPPPVHGMSKNTQIIAAEVRKRVACRVIDLSAKTLDRRQLSYHLSRLGSVLRGVATLLFNARSRKEVAYIAADSGFGMIYTLLLISVAKLRGCELVIHHRSFRYVDRSRLLMVAISKLMRSGLHVFLCRTMKDRFQELYPVGRSTIVSNARYVEVIGNAREQLDAPVVIGLISNLCREKGLHDFIDLIEAIKTEGLAFKAILAGPASCEDDRRVIAQSLVTHSDVLEYRGPVYEGEKARFYDDIDVLIFPTRYETEAQPNVVFEALARARPAIAFDRGCIAPDLDGCGLVVPEGGDFVAAALAQIKRWSDDRSELARCQVQARELAKRHRDASVIGHADLIAYLTGATVIGDPTHG